MLAVSWSEANGVVYFIISGLMSTSPLKKIVNDTETIIENPKIVLIADNTAVADSRQHNAL